MSVDATLEGLVRAHGRADGVAWLEAVLRGPDDLRVVFPAVARKVGRDGLATAATVAGEDGEVSLAAWRVDDAARVLLLRRRGDLRLAGILYEAGDARERCGALRALSLLPGARDDAAALPIVLDAMRVTQGEIFEAAILDSPYASRHLPQHEWRKAVLKALFLGHSIRRVARLEERADADLARSLLDFALEREAATRSVPPELWPVAALHPPRGLVAKLIGYLEHPSPEHRRAAAVALGRIGDPAAAPFLADRAEREPDDAVRAALRG